MTKHGLTPELAPQNPHHDHSARIRRPAGTGQQNSVHASAPRLVGSDGSNELLPSAITWPRCLQDDSRPSAGFLKPPAPRRRGRSAKCWGKHLADGERTSERASERRPVSRSMRPVFINPRSRLPSLAIHNPAILGRQDVIY